MPSKLSKRMFIGTLSGIFLEYFDYTLYGFSTPFIASEFFPAEKPAIELLLAWGVFAISFLVRPIGSVIFGHFADRLGRRHILILTILLMSLATILIGLLPTYHQAGLIAPIALLICRILQGLSVSTEYSGCSTYLLEFKKSRQGLISGIITSASGFGIFCASLLVLLFNSFTHDFLLLANWRWPFIIAGIVIGFLGFYLRLGLMESPEFLTIQQHNKIARFPLWKIICEQPRALIKTILISAYVGITIILIEIYLPSYLQAHLHFHKTTALRLSTYLALIEACFAILWGGFSDHLGRTKTIAIAGILMLICILPLLQLFYLNSFIFWILAASTLALLVAAGDGPMAAFLTSSFPTQVRYTGVSLSYNIGAAIFGGLSPSVLLLIQSKFNLSDVFAYYLMISAVIMLLVLKFL